MFKPNELGYILLNVGFEPWFRYMFRVINNTPYTCEPLHKELLAKIQDVIDGKTTRLNLNLCPRSSKTTTMTWLVVYALTINPKSQIIYTSFNQELLTSVSQQVASIMNHPVYQAMFSQSFTQEDEEVDPIDDFWKDYLKQTENKIKFSSRKILTPQGGVVLFNSVGSAITGFGCGVRGQKGFNGFLVLDDADKPTDVRSQKIREKTHVYFQETLLSRLNNPDTPILNVQQRLHIDDLSGFLADKYGFEVFKFPLLDENGNCNLGKQYTPERIKELQVDNYTFSAQYQQEPILLGGGVIKHEWWRFYKNMHDCPYRRIFITADTAMKTKEWNDFTAIGVWGLTNQNKLRMLDLVHGKFEIPELESTMLALWEKWRMGIGTCRCSAIYIEDKASGTQLIQTLMRKGGLPIMRLMPEKDKYTRVTNAIPQLAAGNVELPESDQHPLSKLLIDEADAFTADDSHLHDDLCFVAGTQIATLWGYKPIEKIKPGEFIITPIGIRRCVVSRMTGIKNTITRMGLEATPDHKVFYTDKFERLDRLTNANKCSILTLKELVKWTYKKQLYSMESHINLWGREDIISLNQNQILDERVRKDFILRCGNIIREKQYRKAMSFITKTITALTTTMIIWSVFRVANILKCTQKKTDSAAYLEQKNGKNIFQTFVHWLLRGINPQRDLRGTNKMQKNKEQRKSLENATGVASCLNAKLRLNKDFVPEYAPAKMRTKYKKPVYNITVENAGCYYANDILVSNCDMWCYAVDQAFNSRGII